jgi:hypothetical protein
MVGSDAQGLVEIQSSMFTRPRLARDSHVVKVEWKIFVPRTRKE